MSFTVSSIFTAVDKFSSPVKNMSSNVQKFAQRAEIGISRAERSFRRLTPAIGGVTRQLLSFASAAAIGALIFSSISFSFGAIKDAETNLASLQAITGVSNDTFKEFQIQINAVARETKKSSVEIAKAFEVVGSAKPELLKDAVALAEVTKASVILSKATREDLTVSTKSLTGTLNQFNLSADQSMRVINALSAGSQAGAAAVPLISEAIDKFGTAANSLNISVEESIGLIETLAEKELKGAEAGTKIRNVLLKLATAKALPKEAIVQLEKFGVNTDIVSNKSLSLKERLTELSKIQDDATALTKVFGKENFIAGQVILQNVDKVESFTKAVTGTNTALEQERINSDTLSVAITELQAAWINIITGNKKVTGSLNIVKNILQFVASNLSDIVGIISLVIGAWLAMKTALFIARTGLTAYNVILGVSMLLQGKSALALRSNAIALNAFTIAAKIATVATGAFNLIMSLNPIVATVIAIIALIGVITLVVKKWNEWGAAVSFILGPIGFVISLVQSFRRNWDNIADAFKTEGIIGGLKAIGITILDAVLMPLQQVFELLSNIPLVGKFAQIAVDKLQGFREDLGVNLVTNEAGEKFASPVIGEETKEVISPQATAEQARTDRFEITENQKTQITIKDETGKAEIESDNNITPVVVTPTFAF